MKLQEILKNTGGVKKQGNELFLHEQKIYAEGNVYNEYQALYKKTMSSKHKTSFAENLYNLLLYIENIQKEGKTILSKWQFRIVTYLLRKKTNAAIFSSYYAECLKKCSDKKIAKILEKKIEVIKTDYGNKSIVIRENIDNFINIRKVKIIHLLEKTKKYFPSAETNPENIVELRNVKKYYCNENVAFNILNNINLQIQKGKFIVILGSSGSGKTTLMNIISGMDNSTYGQVVVNNIDITNMNAAQLTDFRRKNIGYIFQQYGLLPNLTVKENVEIGYSLQPDKSQRLDIDEILKSVEMYDYKNKMPHELSGGQQQRVSIARSIVKNPAIIFGDEPTGAVDEKMSKMIMELFIKVNKEYKTTVIIVTHNHIIAELADIVIYVGHGSIEKVVYNEHPKNPNELKW